MDTCHLAQAVLLELPPPTTTIGVQRFLGMINHYRSSELPHLREVQEYRVFPTLRFCILCCQMKPLQLHSTARSKPFLANVPYNRCLCVCCGRRTVAKGPWSSMVSIGILLSFSHLAREEIFHPWQRISLTLQTLPGRGEICNLHGSQANYSCSNLRDG